MRLLVALCLLFSVMARAGDTARLYNPAADARKDIHSALQTARREKKNLMIQVGGNWCSWCYKFNAFVQLDSGLKRQLADNFVVYHLNYSKENKNLDLLREYRFPQRFGFPVLLVVDANGKLLHTQDSSLLEKGNGYDHDKVLGFFRNWAPGAFDPALYKNDHE